ncbi:MAG: PAS domain-containing protein, partial [Flavobacteriales bacterium]|nr:PAS domain-containing protein [Flavobacteriales bacterium]
YLGAKSGLDLLMAARVQGLSKPVIMLTGQDDKRVDIASLKAGASDYLSKGELSTQILERTVRYAVSRYVSQQQLIKEKWRYAALFEQSLDPVVILTREMDIYECNQSFVELVEYDADQGERVNIFSFFKDEEEGRKLKEVVDQKRFVKNSLPSKAATGN